MRKRRVLAFGPCCMTLAVFIGMHQPGLVQAQEVERFIQVLDTDGARVVDLRADEFIVEHAGVGVELARVELINDPLRVALLVDDADGARGYFRYLRDGLPVFVDALPDTAEIALVLLSGRPRVVVDYTEDREKLNEQLGSFFVDANQAASFFPGLTETVDRWDEAVRWPILAVVTTDGAAQRRMTDGRYDTFLDEIRDRAVTIHALSLFTPGGQGFQTAIASHITQVTGGWYDSLNSPSQSVSTKLTEMAAEISRRHAETQNQYVVTYEPPPGTDPDAPISAAVRRADIRLNISMDGRPRPSVRPQATTSGGASAAGREELFNAGEAAFAGGNIDQAADWYQKAHAADPSWGKPLFKLALVALNTGDTEAAVQYLEQTVEVAPGSDDAAQATALLAQLRP